ncbi:unnamed protein product [Coffea canephora]|uniref:TFIIS N-terminal domain-containing protein n=2 Tax=Coffea TaxID=13442 RepID=A0A068VH63_COFCA|nr:probable mediator of RNA polymerase II transcription subunit 26c [Coffea arabica]CDP19914.1 unnamed protein product [Coffea canephora]
MDLDEFRVILSKSKVDVWSLIEAAITVAGIDYSEELKDRRDKIVEKLYFPSSSGQVCRNCHSNDVGDDYLQPPSQKQHQQQQEKEKDKEQNRNQSHRSSSSNSKSPLTPESSHGNDENEDEDNEMDPYGGLFDDEQTKIVKVRELLEDPDQSEESVVELLQTLVDMDITFTALQETDIGRVVSGFRKQHPSNEVRKLAKLLVRNWKETVDEWVRLNQPDQGSVALIADGDSPQQNIQPKTQQNGHHQGSEFAYSPNPRNGGSSSEKNYSEPQTKPKPAPPREASSRPPQSVHKSASAPPPSRSKEPTIDLEKLNSARRRLHENYQEAENAKKQRTIQVMDIHELPKPKNAFFGKNKGGFQGRHHR